MNKSYVHKWRKLRQHDETGDSKEASTYFMACFGDCFGGPDLYGIGATKFQTEILRP
jgi:hypothetical protein